MCLSTQCLCLWFFWAWRHACSWFLFFLGQLCSITSVILFVAVDKTKHVTNVVLWSPKTCSLASLFVPQDANPHTQQQTYSQPLTYIHQHRLFNLLMCARHHSVFSDIARVWIAQDPLWTSRLVSLTLPFLCVPMQSTEHRKQLMFAFFIGVQFCSLASDLSADTEASVDLEHWAVCRLSSIHHHSRTAFTGHKQTPLALCGGKCWSCCFLHQNLFNLP